jgi:hypothetical protein
MLRAFVAGLAVAATAAIAQAPEGSYRADQGKRVEANGDPDQIVCRSEGQIGSRLAARRTCRTRAEWAQHHDDSRETVEKVQYFKPTCPTGNGRC